MHPLIRLWGENSKKTKKIVDGKCPHCAKKNIYRKIMHLEKFFIKEKTRKHRKFTTHTIYYKNVYSCPNCYGLWLHEEEIMKYV